MTTNINSLRVHVGSVVPRILRGGSTSKVRSLRVGSKLLCSRRDLATMTLSSSSSELDSKLPPDVAEVVQKYVQKPQTPASLQTLMRTGRGELLKKTYRESEMQDTAATELILMQVAGFLRREIPIRLAHRIQDLDRVPLMGDMPSVEAVRDIYISSFMELVDQPKIGNPEQEEEFATKLQTIYEKHSNVLIQMAKGAFELRAAVRNGEIKGTTGRRMKFDEMDGCHSFLDRFYMSRIGMRVLVGQYIALRQPPMENFVGMICKETSPYEIVHNAVEDAKFMCDRKFGDSPEVIISGRKDLTFSYIPDHLHYILLELLKNALRATVETHGVDSDFPPVEVIIADGKANEDVAIKIADEGGGIPRSVIHKIWSYLFTTADPSIQEGLVAFSGEVDHSTDSPLAGLGYGLPISRSYARYFGGDVSIMSLDGFGTDAFVYLPRLGSSREPLPV
mmetsp:Transcript_22979/g.47798  ORF Transcript_22979/g.47798 Transcript_22979/m.47798 type:complete len:450 (+) Transcript_22979:37-1386(+)